ncbi:unnamed protein product, partial [marine sediment metagenome]
QNEKYFNLYKQTATLETMISTYQGAQDAFTSLAKIPYVGVALGIAAAAAATLAGLARVAMIQSQVYQGHAAGGWLDTHPKGGKINGGAGGKDDVFLGTTPGVAHWGMKDEFVFVMNKEETKRQGALLEMMNKGLAKGGWMHRGYGLDLSFKMPSFDIGKVTDPFAGGIELPGIETFLSAVGGLPLIKPALEGISELWEALTDVPEIPEIEFDPDVFDSINYSIRQMMDETTALEDMTESTRQQFKGWIKQLEEMNASEEQLAQVRDQEQAVIDHLTATMKEDFIKPLEDIIAEGVMTEYGYELLQLGRWYEEQKIEAEELGLELDILNAAYAIQREEIEATRELIEEDIIRRLGVLREAAVPGAGLSAAELAIFDLT